MMRAPLFFDTAGTTGTASTTGTAGTTGTTGTVGTETLLAPGLKLLKCALSFATYLKSLFPNDWIQESMDQLTIGILLSGRVVTFRVSLHHVTFTSPPLPPPPLVPDRVAAIFDPVPQALKPPPSPTTTPTTPTPTPPPTTRYLLGCDIYILVPRRGAASLSVPLSKGETFHPVERVLKEY